MHANAIVVACHRRQQRRDAIVECLLNFVERKATILAAAPRHEHFSQSPRLHSLSVFLALNVLWSIENNADYHSLSFMLKPSLEAPTNAVALSRGPLICRRSIAALNSVRLLPTFFPLGIFGDGLLRLYRGRGTDRFGGMSCLRTC